jgi:predicted ArsR family transcriptional regulator
MELLMSDELTKTQKVLLEALQSSKDWMTRKAIAEKLGVSELSHYYVQQLKVLEDLGLIESRQVTIGVVMTAYEYKAL